MAVVDKWRINGPPAANPKNPAAPGATNPVKFYTYTFVPRRPATGAKLPMLVFSHGGVHGDFTTYYIHIVRELIAPGLRRGRARVPRLDRIRQGFYQLIDYGGREVEDAPRCQGVGARDARLR